MDSHPEPCSQPHWLKILLHKCPFLLLGSLAHARHGLLRPPCIPGPGNSWDSCISSPRMTLDRQLSAVSILQGEDGVLDTARSPQAHERLHFNPKVKHIPGGFVCRSTWVLGSSG